MENNAYSEALKNAVASVEMEGYTVSQQQKDLSLDFLVG